MILADTSIWVDHLRKSDARLTALLLQNAVWTHPYIAGALALGNLRSRNAVLTALDALPSANVASADEVRALIEGKKMIGLGIGYVDAHLIASALLTQGLRIWTRDKRLSKLAGAMGLAVAI